MLASQIQIHIMIHKLIHIFMHIDKMCLQQNATQMLRANTVPSPKYKCLVPAQNRLPNALVEEVEGGLNNLEIKLFVVFIFIMTFLHMCEILECIVGFYAIVFYLAHIVALYTSIVLLSYLMLVIYISVPVAHFVEGDKI